jgi:hypothetical protein
MMFKKFFGGQPSISEQSAVEEEKAPELIPVYEDELPDGYELFLGDPALVEGASLTQDTGFFDLRFINGGAINIFDQNAAMVNNNPCDVRIIHKGNLLVEKETGTGILSVEVGSSAVGIVQSGGVRVSGGSSVSGVKQTIKINR